MQAQPETYCLLCLKNLDPHLRNIQHLECGHLYHKTCYERWHDKIKKKDIKAVCPGCMKVPEKISEPETNKN